MVIRIYQEDRRVGPISTTMSCLFGCEIAFDPNQSRQEIEIIKVASLVHKCSRYLQWLLQRIGAGRASLINPELPQRTH